MENMKIIAAVIAAVLVIGVVSGYLVFYGDDDEEDEEEDMFDLMINIEGQGTVEVNEDEIEDGWSEEYEDGTEVDLEAIADNDWYFDEWTGDASGTDNTTIITMDSDKSITANFIDEDAGEGTSWNAYDFESEVEVQEEAVQSFLANNNEENKTLKEFTYNHTFVNGDGQHMNFTIETTYMGISQTEITVTKLDASDLSKEQVSVNLQTYELDHTIDVDIEGDNTHPEYINMTVHIPTGNFSTEEVETPSGFDDYSNFWIYSKVEFTDTNDNWGLFSYHLTENMKDEMENDDDIYYVPYVEGDFDSTDYDEWVLYGIYGHCWSWFQPFAEDTAIEEGTHSLHGFEFYVENTTFTLNGYTFDGFHIGSEDITFGEESVHLKGSFVPSLPIPVYLRAGQNNGDAFYEMQLTSIVLE